VTAPLRIEITDAARAQIAAAAARYCIYYRVAGDALQVLAFWHASRGEGPHL
jgi:hypothetical protein